MVGIMVMVRQTIIGWPADAGLRCGRVGRSGGHLSVSDLGV